MRTVRLLLHDALAVLEGRAMTVSDDEGNECVVRLFTAEEFLPEQHAAVDRLRPGNTSLKIDLAQAQALTQPLRVTRAEPADGAA